MDNQYSVFHIEKRTTITTAFAKHLFRGQSYEDGSEKIFIEFSPDNANPEKEAQNIYYPLEFRERPNTDGLINQIIQERGVKTVRKNSNKILEIILSGSAETMQSMDEPTLRRWFDDNLEWSRKTFGAENIFCACMHCDETTPHIHLCVIPITEGESRRTRAKYKKLKQEGKEFTARKTKGGPRLSAHDFTSREQLREYQTSYAKEIGAKYGLQRGVEAEPGSKRRHTTSIEYNAELKRQTRDLTAQKSELAGIPAKLEQAKKGLEKVDKQKQATQTEIDKLTAQKSELAGIPAKLEQAKKGLEKVDKQKQTTQTEIDKLTAQKTKLAGEINSLTALKVNLAGKIDKQKQTTQTEIDKLKEEVDKQKQSAQTEIDKLTTQKAMLAREVADLNTKKTELAGIPAKLERANKELEIVSKQIECADKIKSKIDEYNQILTSFGMIVETRDYNEAQIEQRRLEKEKAKLLEEESQKAQKVENKEEKREQNIKSIGGLF